MNEQTNQPTNELHVSHSASQDIPHLLQKL